ncbi:MAG: hypothetical protein HUJ52_01085 [Malacoplasma sp.]|nr:hypothetical protein [Malacoplasma sp.]
MNNQEINEIKVLLKQLGYDKNEANILIREYEGQHLTFKEVKAMLEKQLNDLI